MGVQTRINKNTGAKLQSEPEQTQSQKSELGGEPVQVQEHKQE